MHRGTFLGSAWGPFQDVKRVWAEFFEGKPYKSHVFGIAGIRRFPVPLCDYLAATSAAP
jgi:hypothetical protein